MLCLPQSKIIIIHISALVTYYEVLKICQKMGSILLVKIPCSKQSKWQEMEKKLREKEKKPKRSHFEYKQQSRNAHGRKIKQKRNYSVFLPKMSWIISLAIRNVVIPPNWRKARFFRLRCVRFISYTISFQLKTARRKWCFHCVAWLVDKWFKTIVLFFDQISALYVCPQTWPP